MRIRQRIGATAASIFVLFSRCGKSRRRSLDTAGNCYDKIDECAEKRRKDS
jgi:hypothetical protein